MKIVVGMTGASGAIYGVRLLESLAKHSVETHLVVSQWARETLKLETDVSLETLHGLASKIYEESDMAASISSGSFYHDGMVVIPCSMKTLAGIRYGFSQNLIQRAADVTLKEKRKLVLVPRESPLSSIHLENMLSLSQMGVFIAPPSPSFYHQPDSILDIVDFSAMRILDILGIREESTKRLGDANG